MSAQDIVDRIVAVLARAESLFTSPATGPKAGEVLGAAAESSRAIAARTEELSGAAASAHGGLLATSGDGLARAADTDSQLAEALSRAGQAHADGASQASGLRLGAEELPSALGPWSDLPAAELAGLLALRSQVADMQRLIVEHSSQAARAADDILSMGYQP